MRSIATALEMYNNHNDVYPSSEEGVEKLKEEKYIKNVPDLRTFAHFGELEEIK